jgi:hypothetical protein
VIHYLSDEAEQRQLLLAITRRLKRGAPLTVAEMIGNPTSPQFQRFLEAWKLRQSTFGATAEEIEPRARTLSSVVSFPSV